MNLSNTNIKISQRFRFYESSWVFCVLLLTISILSTKGVNTFFTITSQYNADNAFIQASKRAHQSTFLFAFELVEEVETSDENIKGHTTEGAYLLYTSTYFSHPILKSSFANFTLSLQKRISIPLFLLHHSWRIPSV